MVRRICRMKKGALFLTLFFNLCLLGTEAICQDSEIVAKIGDETITRQDLEVRRPTTMAGTVEETERMRQTAMDPKRMLNESIDLTLLATEARKTEVMNNPVLKAKIRFYVDGLIVQEYVNSYIDSLISIPEDEILELYKTTPKYQQKEVIRVRHILVNTEEEAKEILNKIKAGEDFAKLAKERSIDENVRKTGGDLGWFPRGVTVKPFEEAAFSLKEGEVSDPVKTEFGYHIIKLENRKTDPPVELEKVRSEIVKQLMLKKKKEFVAKKLEALRASTPIEILSDKYKDQK